MSLQRQTTPEFSLHFAEVDRKLDLLAQRLESCLEGISSLQQARPESSNLFDARSSSCPSTAKASLPNQSPEGFGLRDVADELPNGAPWVEQMEPPPAMVSPAFDRGSDRGNVWGSDRGSDRGSDCGSPCGRRLSRSSSVQALEAAALKMFQSRSQWKRCVWNFMEESESGCAARWARARAYLVVASVLVTLTQTVETPPLSGAPAAVLETIIDATFGLEVLVRCIVCPDLWGFMKSPFNIIDIFSALPMLLRAAAGFVLPPELRADSATHFTLLCVVPVIRLLKILRHNGAQWQLFALVLGSTIETLVFLFFVGCLLILTFASMIYLVEPRDNIDSYPRAMWLTIVTMTTVGYGDVAPATYEGRTVVSALVLCSMLYMALPIGVLGNAFTFVWKDRDRLLLIDRTRRRLAQWGYSAHDVPSLFHHFDSDGDGELSLADFRNLLREFRVVLQEERVVDLFETFDKDNGGSIDDKEFLHAVFPRAWHEIMQQEKLEEEKEREKEREKKEKRKARSRVVSHSPAPTQPPSSGLLGTTCPSEVVSSPASHVSVNMPEARSDAWGFPFAGGVAAEASHFPKGEQDLWVDEA